MAVKKIFNITVDLKYPLSNREFEVVAMDTGNVIVVTMVDDGTAVDLSGCRTMLIVSNPGGSTHSQDSGTTGSGVSIGGADNNIITIDLFSTSYSEGVNECEIQIYSGDNDTTMITSARFNFRAQKPILNDSTIESVPEYPILVSLIDDVEHLAAREQPDWAETNETRGTFIKNKPSSYTPSAHASDHGSDGTDAVTPASIGASDLAHAARHATGGEDPITPASIGAASIVTASAALPASGWVSNAQTVSVAGVTASNHPIVTPAPASTAAWSNALVYASAQGEGTMTFSCRTTPTADLTANVLIIAG